MALVTQVQFSGGATEAEIVALGYQHGMQVSMHRARMLGARRNSGTLPHLSIAPNESCFVRDGQFDADACERHTIWFYGVSGPRGIGDIRRVLRDLKKQFRVEVLP